MAQQDSFLALHPTIKEILSISSTVRASIGAFHRGQAAYNGHFGFRDHDREQPPNSDTLYTIGYLSKAMLAQAIGSLVDEGSVSWDALVSDVIPEFKSHDSVITENCTLIDLLAHRSELPTFNVLWYQGGSISLVRKRDIIPMINVMLERPVEYGARVFRLIRRFCVPSSFTGGRP